MFSRSAPHPALLNLRRTFANRLPRPPPKDLPPPETFSSTSRPRQYYSRPQPRDLPPYRVSRAFFPPLFPTIVVQFGLWLCEYSAPGLAFSQCASAASAHGPHF